MTTPSTPTSTMKPCPFCGEVLKHQASRHGDDYYRHSRTNPCPLNGGSLGDPITVWDDAEHIAAWNRRSPVEAQPSAVAGEAEQLADEICREVAELPDRNSPEDWPEAMLVTHDELRAIVLGALAAPSAVLPLPPQGKSMVDTGWSDLAASKHAKAREGAAAPSVEPLAEIRRIAHLALDEPAKYRRDAVLTQIAKLAAAPVETEQPVGHVDMRSKGPGDRIKWTGWALPHGTPLYARPTPAAGVPPDDALEVMIAASDGHWREDVFCIGGPELMDLLRHVGRAALSAGAPSSPNPALTEALESFDHALSQWAEAYPLTAFPEPDFKAVGLALRAAGITLDSVSASSMRHVVTTLDDLFAPVRAAMKESPHG